MTRRLMNHTVFERGASNCELLLDGGSHVVVGSTQRLKVPLPIRCGHHLVEVVPKDTSLLILIQLSAEFVPFADLREIQCTFLASITCLHAA
jgi:hypothetical protein